MKKNLLIIALSILMPSLFAQNKDLTYKQKAAEIQKQIWDVNSPSFVPNTVPTSLANESAVVIARSFDMQRIAGGRIKYMIVTAASVPRVVTETTFREKVKINDKSALEKYSKIEYKKTADKSVSFGLGKIVDVQSTYIGIKIIKPDGNSQIVNPDEEVLIKNETSGKEGKVAVPGLQIGDVIDYYISKISTTEDQEKILNDSDFFLYLADEYPIINYHMSFQFNKKMQLSYLSANGAPEFVKTTNADGDQILNLDMKNIPKYKNNLWTSPARQQPYITLRAFYESKYNNALMGVSNDRGNPNASPLVNALTMLKETAFNEALNPIFEAPHDYLKKYYGGNKAINAAPLDSTMSVLYDGWRFSVFCTYNGKDFDMTDKKHASAKSVIASVNMSKILSKMDIDHEILIVASRNSNSLQNYLSAGDFDAIIKIIADKPFYMSFNNVVTHFNEIPAKFQGEKAISLKPEKGKKNKFIEGETVIPVIGADENFLYEQVNVSLMPDNKQKVKIQRTLKLAGAMRHQEQLRFLLFEDIDLAFTAKFKEDDLSKRLSVNYSKAIKNNYFTAFSEARADMKSHFIKEIEEDYEQEPKLLANFKVINPALEKSNPVFEYTGTFVLDNYSKKTGENYIIDFGKLIGSDTKLDDEERKRNVDVYMPAARTIKYDINFTIPKGYKLTGIEELNMNKSNKAGSFTSMASLTKDVLSVNIKKVYKNNFEKAADWPLLVEMLDATYDLSIKKVLIEKL